MMKSVARMFCLTMTAIDILSYNTCYAYIAVQNVSDAAEVF